MMSAELAVALRDAGVRWTPAAGDRFVIPQPGLDGEVFTLSEMTIEAREYPTGTILGFNGTTEWALDSVAQEEALWIPREDQVRGLLGGTFVTLSRIDPSSDASDGDGDDGTDGHRQAAGTRDDGVAEDAVRFEVTTRVPDGRLEVHAAPSAADAYALALLSLVERATAQDL